MKSIDEQDFHDLKINSDQKAPASVSDIDLLNALGVNLDDTNPLPSFSIREYVFNSRNKDIACNWPFSHESLQHCLPYGVKKLLPPFKSVGLRRGKRCTGGVNRFNGKPAHDQFESFISSGMKSNQECQTAVKKVNSGVELIKEVKPTTVSIVCPVCKTFSSSSNTTLNAHIDQCLSGESSSKRTTNSKTMVKHRIKPKKIRSMMDMYEPATCCNVEEFNKKFYTSWAANSNFTDQELESQEEEKEELDFISEVADQEGAVCIDTNGKKVRILSVPKVGTSDYHEARKCQKGGKGSKVEPEKKKNNVYRRKHCQKKLSPSGKMFHSLRSHHGDSEVKVGREKNVTIKESCNREDGGENPMKAREHTQTDLEITRSSCACSKRSGFPRKFRGKDVLRHLRHGAMKDLQKTVPSSSDTVSSRTSSSMVKSFPIANHDSCEDPMDSRSNGSKFAFGTHKHVYLKRKSSALEKSLVGRSQDSSEQNSGIEENTSSNGVPSGGLETNGDRSYMGVRNLMELDPMPISNGDSLISNISNPCFETLVDLIFTEEGSIPICSKKDDTFTQTGASNDQESALLRKRQATESKRRHRDTNCMPKRLSPINHHPPPPLETEKSCFAQIGGSNHQESSHLRKRRAIESKRRRSSNMITPP